MISKVELYNEVTGMTMTFDETHFSHILETCDLGRIEGVRNEQALVGQDGILIADVVYGVRTISIVVWLVGRDDATISAYRRTLNRFVDPKQRIHIKQNGYSISGLPVHTVAYGTAITVLNEKMCRCLIEVLCDDPLFTDASDTTVGVATWEPKFVFPLQFDLAGDTMVFGLRSASQVVQVQNDGDVKTGVLITFKASGTVIGPKIINISTQEHIQVNTTLLNGELLTVDTRGRVPLVRKIASSGAVTNVINLVTDSSKFFKLPLGLSNFSYTATSNVDSLEVSVSYVNRYLEVL